MLEKSSARAGATALRVFRSIVFSFSCLTSVLILHVSLFAQPNDIRFDHISVEQGLSHFSVTAIVQDQQGFLWFGTEDGLNKYDGRSFTVYRPDPNDTSSLFSPFIHDLYVDRHGRLWVGAGGGLCRYNPDTDDFVRYRHEAHDPNSLLGHVQDIIEDSMGNLWVGTNAGLNLYNHAKDDFSHYLPDPEIKTSPGNVVISILEDGAGALWIGTAAGLKRYEAKKNVFVHYPHDIEGSSDPVRNYISQIMEDSRGVIWLGTGEGLHRYDRKTGTIVRYHDPQNPPTINHDWIFAIYEDSRGVLWVGTFNSGLFRYDADTDRFFRYAHDPNNPYSLDKNRVSCIYEDRSGVLWVGTYRGGLNRYDRKQEAFIRYQIDDAVYAVLQDWRNDLWLGTGGNGLLRLKQNDDRQQNRVKQYLHDPQNPESLSDNNVLAIYEDSNGEIWIGTGRGLNRYDTKRKGFVRYRHEPIDSANPGHHSVKAIYEDCHDELWIGTNGSGLCRLDRRSKTFTYYRNDPKNPQSLSDNTVWSIAEDKDGNLWIGTFGGGLNRFDGKTGTFIRYQHDPENSRSLSQNAIYSVCADPSGSLWLGTFGGGLNRFDPNTGAFTHYMEKDGSPDNFVKGILPDSKGNLWLSTDKGLSRFEPKTQTFRNYTKKDGLHHNVFLSGACHHGRDGRFYFGGENGVTVFHPDSIKAKRCVSPVALTSFKVFDQPLPLPHSLASTREIRLSYKQNFFSFESAVLDYSIPERNQYAHKLEGFDRDWIHAGVRRYASYTNVPPGEYVLRIKGANSDGAWNEKGVAVKIIITPPLWKTWWFTGLFWAALFVTIGGTIRYVEIRRLRKRLRALEKQQALERERLRISQDVHDEVGAGLTQIAILSELAKKDLERPQAAEVHIQKISERARQVIDNIGEIIWAINPKHDQLGDFAAYLREYAVHYLMTASIKHHCEFPDSLPDIHLSAEARRNLFLVFKEALHNIVKHAAATEVELRLSCAAQQLEILICDNGRGFSPENPAPFRNGLCNMKKRVEDIGGTFTLQSQPNCGTKINIVVGLGSERQSGKIQ